MINDGMKTNGHAYTRIYAHTKLRCLQCDLQHFINVDTLNNDSHKDSQCLIGSPISTVLCALELERQER